MIKIIIKHKKKIIILSVFFIILYLLFSSRLRMLNLSTGEYIESLDSPNGDYTLKSYKCSGGATMDWFLRVEIVYNNKNKKMNVYYKYHESDSDMKWLDNETAIINGHRLNVFKDYIYA